jgi:hypothetical protein
MATNVTHDKNEYLLEQPPWDVENLLYSMPTFNVKLLFSNTMFASVLAYTGTMVVYGHCTSS